MTNLTFLWPIKVKYHNTKVLNLEMLLNLLLNSARTGWVNCQALLAQLTLPALKVLLNVTQKFNRHKI